MLLVAYVHFQKIQRDHTSESVYPHLFFLKSLRVC